MGYYVLAFQAKNQLSPTFYEGIWQLALKRIASSLKLEQTDLMEESDTQVIECPVCNRKVCFKHFSDATYFPFCSRKCKLVDLGRWFNEEYSIERDLDVSDFEDAEFADD